MNARIVAVHVNSGASRTPLTRLDRAELIEETGVRGDRHVKLNSRRQVLVVEKEVLDELSLAPATCASRSPRKACASPTSCSARGCAAAPPCSRWPPRATRATAWRSCVPGSSRRSAAGAAASCAWSPPA